MKKLSFRKRILLTVILTAAIIITLAMVLTSCDSGGSPAPNEDSSETNTQEQGIDEADIVKVNGNGYIFKAQTDGVTVSRAENGNLSLLKKSKANDAFTPLEMFFYNDLVIVIGAKVICEYNYYGYYYAPSYQKTVVKIYDMAASTGEELVLRREDEFFGTYKTSRLFTTTELDGTMYIVTNYYASINSTDLASLDITDGYGRGFIISKIDLKNPIKYTAGFYANNAYDIYFSPYAIYALRYDFSHSYGGGCNSYQPYSSRNNDILKISLSSLEKLGTISIQNAYIPDRFCLYDNGEYFFVASQSYTNPTGTYVRSYDKELNEKSTVGPMATGEQIKSARFEGTECFVVTFRRVDPLFKIDISDPLNMRLTGELKIDGFSTYMQSFGDGVLIGVGYGANTNDLKITAFDVSGDHPDEINSILLEYGYSEARNDPRAILCSSDKNIFAFSATANRLQTNGTYISSHGAYIFGLKDGELKEIAYISLFSGVYSVPHNRVIIKRLHWIGDYLYVITDGYIFSYKLSEVMNGTFSAQEPVDSLCTIISGTDIFAKWTVTFDTGEEGSSVPGQYILNSETATEPPVPIREGYIFKYWYKENENVKYNFENPVRNDFTLHAKWEPIETDDDVEIDEGDEGETDE